MSGLKTVYPASKFRPDIQGLRAIAVVLVLLFHLFPLHVSGGYVGVDVFFVISGFLITGILLRSAEQKGRIGLWDFYERRVRRLLPAACVTLAICALGVFIFLPETRWADIGMEIIASAFYFENFYLYFASLDYLAADYDPSPFQHYWSLSIEEQFYVVWPLLLLAGLAYARRAGVEPRAVYMALCAGILAVSLTISIIVTPENPGAYFLTQARIWELSLGGLVATLHPYVNPGKKSSAFTSVRLIIE